MKKSKRVKLMTKEQTEKKTKVKSEKQSKNKEKQQKENKKNKIHKKYITITTVLVLLLVVLLIVTGLKIKNTKSEEKMSNRIAVIETNMGTIKVELFEDKAPITTSNFIELIEKGDVNDSRVMINQNMMATADDEGMLALWDLNSWEEVISIQAHAARIHGMDISPDENYLATAAEDGSVLRLADDPGYVIEATTGRQVYFPGRTWDGENRLEIATSVRWSAAE